MQSDDYYMEDEQETLEQEFRGVSDARGSTIQDILSSLFDMQPTGVRSAGGDAPRIRSGGITLHDLTRLLSGASASTRYTRAIGPDDEEGSEEYEDEDEEERLWRTRKGPNQWFPEVKEPQQAGVDLLMSGEFGRIGPKVKSRREEINLSRSFTNRSSRLRPYHYKEDFASDLVPNTNGTAVAIYDANIYSGQFSADSSFYYTCSQDFRLHIYDTVAAPLPSGLPALSRRLHGGHGDQGLDTTMKVIKGIQGHPGRWTITDSHLNQSNDKMIYSSITPTVYMTSTLDSNPEQIPIPFADVNPRSRFHDGWDSFGIWSCRFSADGNEVVAGGSGKLFVYDLIANRRTVKILAHNDDVNSCCWADTTSGNVLVSASDDTFLKVWDRRSLGSSRKPSGVLVGHTEGITNVSAKGDGRYIISNGKDQALRLWDLRKMRSSSEFEAIEDDFYGLPNFDYRYPHYPKPRRAAHPNDCSVMTYRGHSVLRTLIRCHFSPAETTGGQYLYSGSADGKIHIWSLDGQVVQVLDRAKTLPMSSDPSAPEPETANGARANICVRDVSWHSKEPVLMSAGWDNGTGGSVVARHEWKGLMKMPGALEDWVEKRKQESDSSPTGRRRSKRQELARRRASQQVVPGAYETESDEQY